MNNSKYCIFVCVLLSVAITSTLAKDVQTATPLPYDSNPEVVRKVNQLIEAKEGPCYSEAKTKLWRCELIAAQKICRNIADDIRKQYSWPINTSPVKSNRICDQGYKGCWMGKKEDNPIMKLLNEFSEAHKKKLADCQKSADQVSQRCDRANTFVKCQNEQYEEVKKSFKNRGKEYFPMVWNTPEAVTTPFDYPECKPAEEKKQVVVAAPSAEKAARKKCIAEYSEVLSKRSIECIDFAVKNDKNDKCARAEIFEKCEKDVYSEIQGEWSKKCNFVINYGGVQVRRFNYPECQNGQKPKPEPVVKQNVLSEACQKKTAEMNQANKIKNRECQVKFSEKINAASSECTKKAMLNDNRCARAKQYEECDKLASDTLLKEMKQECPTVPSFALSQVRRFDYPECPKAQRVLSGDSEANIY